VVVSINRLSPGQQTTNGTSVAFQVTFSKTVTGVDPTDFQVTRTGTVGVTLVQVSAVSGLVYNVTVSGISGSGSLGLNLVDNGSIHDLTYNPLAPSSYALSVQS